MNGIEFYDVKLHVEEAASRFDIDTSSTSNNATGDDGEPEEGPIIAVELDCRLPEWNFVTEQNPNGKIKEAEVCEALVLDFPDDPTKRIQTMWGKQIGVFRIQSNDFNQYLGKKLTIRGKHLELTPVRRKPRQQRGRTHDFARNQHNSNYDPDATRVTIYDANDLHFQDVSNEQFDNYFIELGARVVRQTQPQRNREHREIFTLNRFVVVRTDSEDGTNIDLGNKITVDGHTFKIAYFGMTKYCSLCGRNHGRDCPSKARFKYLEQLRAGKTEKRKIYSDSTMRLVNQLACTTDVPCMTGGSNAQICNMIPFDSKHDEVIINAGTNEIRYESLHEFVYTMDKTVEKIEKLKENENITLVLPTTSTCGAAEEAKKSYIKEKFTAVNGIKVLTPNDVECENAFGRSHPTKDGTRDLMQQINAAFNGEIIMEDCVGDVVSPLKYRLVDPVYKVGCSGCDRPGYTASLCTTCKNEATTVNVEDLRARINAIQTVMFPDALQVQLGQTTDQTTVQQSNNIEMKEVNAKRLLNTDDVPSTASKIARGGN